MLFLLAAITSVPVLAAQRAPKNEKVKNVILIIGDGNLPSGFDGRSGLPFSFPFVAGKKQYNSCDDECGNRYSDDFLLIHDWEILLVQVIDGPDRLLEVDVGFHAFAQGVDVVHLRLDERGGGVQHIGEGGDPFVEIGLCHPVDIFC